MHSNALVSSSDAPVTRDWEGEMSWGMPFRVSGQICSSKKSAKVLRRVKIILEDVLVLFLFVLGRLLTLLTKNRLQSMLLEVAHPFPSAQTTSKKTLGIDQ